MKETRKMRHPRTRIIIATLFAVKVSSTLEKFLISETIRDPNIMSKMPHI